MENLEIKKLERLFSKTFDRDMYSVHLTIQWLFCFLYFPNAVFSGHMIWKCPEIFQNYRFSTCRACRCPNWFWRNSNSIIFRWHSWRAALVTCQAENQLQNLHVCTQVSWPWGTCLLVGHAHSHLECRCSAAPSFRRLSRPNCSKNKNSALWRSEFRGVWAETGMLCLLN